MRGGMTKAEAFGKSRGWGGIVGERGDDCGRTTKGQLELARERGRCRDCVSYLFEGRTHENWAQTGGGGGHRATSPGLQKSHSWEGSAEVTIVEWFQRGG